MIILNRLLAHTGAIGRWAHRRMLTDAKVILWGLRLNKINWKK